MRSAASRGNNNSDKDNSNNNKDDMVSEFDAAGALLQNVEPEVAACDHHFKACGYNPGSNLNSYTTPLALQELILSLQMTNKSMSGISSLLYPQCVITERYKAAYERLHAGTRDFQTILNTATVITECSRSANKVKMLAPGSKILGNMNPLQVRLYLWGTDLHVRYDPSKTSPVAVATKRWRVVQSRYSNPVELERALAQMHMDPFQLLLPAEQFELYLKGAEKPETSGVAIGDFSSVKRKFRLIKKKASVGFKLPAPPLPQAATPSAQVSHAANVAEVDNSLFSRQVAEAKIEMANQCNSQGMALDEKAPEDYGGAASENYLRIAEAVNDPKCIIVEKDDNDYDEQFMDPQDALEMVATSLSSLTGYAEGMHAVTDETTGNISMIETTGTARSSNFKPPDPMYRVPAMPVIKRKRSLGLPPQ